MRFSRVKFSFAVVPSTTFSYPRWPCLSTQAWGTGRRGEQKCHGEQIRRHPRNSAHGSLLRNKVANLRIQRIIAVVERLPIVISSRQAWGGRQPQFYLSNLMSGVPTSGSSTRCRYLGDSVTITSSVGRTYPSS